MKSFKTASSDVEERDDRESSRPEYVKNLAKDWKNWTGMEDKDIEDGLDYITGDLFYEMRKLTSQLCKQNELTVKKIIRESNIVLDGDKEQLRKLFEIVEVQLDLNKKVSKKLINACWKSINDKQKIGVDKLCISVAKWKKDN